MYNIQTPLGAFGEDVEVYSDFAAAIDSYEASMEVIGELQCTLQQRGFDPGPLDGLWGTKTQKGLVAFAKSVGQTKGLTAPTMAELGLDLAEVETAKAYQAAHKGERPVGHIPNSVLNCGALFAVPGAAAAGGFFRRNWKWLLAAGVLVGASVGVAAYIAMRKRDEEEPAFGLITPEANPGFLYQNQYLQQIYGLKGARGRRGMGMIAAEPTLFTYQNPWLQQIYGK